MDFKKLNISLSAKSHVELCETSVYSVYKKVQAFHRASHEFSQRCTELVFLGFKFLEQILLLYNSGLRQTLGS